MKSRKFVIFALIIALSIALFTSCSKRPDDETVNEDPHDAESTWEKIEQEENTPNYVDDETPDTEDLTGITDPGDGTSGNLSDYEGGSETVENDYIYTVGVISSVSDTSLSTVVYKSISGNVLTSYENVDQSDYEETKDKQTVSIDAETPVYYYDGSMWTPKNISVLEEGHMIIVVEAADGGLDSIILVSDI